jgi:hypothetical protein
MFEFLVSIVSNVPLMFCLMAAISFGGFVGLRMFGKVWKHH